MFAIIPYQRFEIKTKYSKNVSLGKIASLVESRKMRSFFTGEHKPFEGELDGFTFNISLVVRFRNDFSPIFIGDIQDSLDVTSLQIIARPRKFAGFLWAASVLMPLYLTVFRVYAFDIGVIWLVYLFFYGLLLATFNYELFKARKLLNKLLVTDTLS